MMLQSETSAFAGCAHTTLNFKGLSQLAGAIGAELLFLELSATSPLKAEKFGIVEVAMFRVRTDGLGQAYTSMVNPECDFDDMTSRALGLSTKDVINFQPWSYALAPFFEKALSEGACIVGVDPLHWTVPSLLRAQELAGRSTTESPYTSDIRDLFKRLMPGVNRTGTVAHLARQMGLSPYPGVSVSVASVFAQVELLNGLVAQWGVESVSDAMAGVIA